MRSFITDFRVWMATTLLAIAFALNFAQGSVARGADVEVERARCAVYKQMFDVAIGEIDRIRATARECIESLKRCADRLPTQRGEI